MLISLSNPSASLEGSPDTIIKKSRFGSIKKTGRTSSPYYLIIALLLPYYRWLKPTAINIALLSLAKANGNKRDNKTFQA